MTITKRLFIRFAVALTIWCSIGGLHVFSRYVDVIRYELPNSVTYSEAIYYLLSYGGWAVLTLFTLSVMKHIADRKHWITLGMSFVVGMFIWLSIFFGYDFVISVLTLEQVWSAFWPTYTGQPAAIIFFYGVLYFLNFVLCLSIVLARRSQQSSQENAILKQRQTESELVLSKQSMQLLQSQLSPHFLFNCLSAISGLARKNDKEAIITAIAQVGGLLRFTIGNAKSPLILLIEELRFAEDYIALQSLRFASRFTYSQKVEEFDQRILCPPFFIQPLLENVFTHAVETSEQHIDLYFELTQKNGQIIITVNNSQPLKSVGSVSMGSALENLRTRLQILYGVNFSLNVKETAKHFLATIVIPLELKQLDV